MITEKVYGEDDKRITLECNSKKLFNDIKKHLDKKTSKGMFGYMGDVEIKGNTFYISNIKIFDLIWTLSSEFNQSIQNSIQFGDVGLVNENGSPNNDTGRCWSNAKLSTRSKLSQLLGQ